MPDESAKLVVWNIPNSGVLAIAAGLLSDRLGKIALIAHAGALAMFFLASPAIAQSWAPVPDPTLTSGAVRSTAAAEICSHGTRELRHWSRERDDRIMAEYGLPAGPHPDFEVDHLIPLCLGGADADANLWAQPRRSLEPEWNAERKDDLEHRLCELVCAGELDVGQAQAEIRDDWTESYRRRFESR